MVEEKRGGVSVHINPKAVEILRQRYRKNYEVDVVAGLDPLMTSEPSIGSLIHSYLLVALGIYRSYRGE